MVSIMTPVNVLLVKLGTEPGLEDIPYRIRKLDPLVRTFGVLSTPTQKNTYDQVLSSSYEATLGAHPEYLKDGLYVRPELYERLRISEGQILRMYERVAISDLTKAAIPAPPIPKYSDSFDDRSQLFLRQVAFWDHALRRNRIAAVVSQNYGHNGYDAVLQAVAIANDIPYMFLHEFRPFLRSLQIYESVDDLASDDLSEKVITSARMKLPYINDSANRRSFMSGQIGLLQSVKNSTSGISGERPPSTRARLAVIFGPKERLIKSLHRRIRNQISVRDESFACSQQPIPENYLFCELQSQPNGTTSVKGWMYPDQRESLAMIANHLPDGWKLVVKESDRQWSRKYPRRKNYWSQIASIPKIHVVKHTSDAESLLKGSRCLVETSYSTLALRAVHFGIPVLILGHTHIADLVGVHCVKSDEDVREVVGKLCGHEIVRFDPLEIRSSLETFVNRKLVSSIEGTLGYIPKFTTKIERQEFIERTVTNVSSAIVAWLHLRLDRD